MVYNMLPWTHPTQHAKRYLDRFSRICTAHGRASQYFTVSRPFSPQKYSFAIACGIWTPSNTSFLGPTRIHNPNGISIASFSVGPTTVTDRPTDHATRSVTIGRTYVRIVLRCGLIMLLSLRDRLHYCEDVLISEVRRGDGL